MTPTMITPATLADLAKQLDGLALRGDCISWNFPVFTGEACYMRGVCEPRPSAMESISLTYGEACRERRGLDYRSRLCVTGLRLDGLLVISDDAARRWRAA